LNDLFFNSDGSIIDMKNTKTELFIVDGKLMSYGRVICIEKCQVSSLKIKTEEKLPFINFKLTGTNLITSNKIIKLSCGTSHCLALSNKGVVFSWGSAANGRLGQGKTTDIAQPQLV
jgi:alpha-tubulin suppressor-like RCC1 family protein